MAKTPKAKSKVENQTISSGDCRQAIHWYTNWLAEKLQAGLACTRGLFATNFEEDDQLLLDTTLSNFEAKGIKALVITGAELYKQADYLWGIALNQAKYGGPVQTKFEIEIRECQFLVLNNLDTPLLPQQLWYLYHYVLYPMALAEKPMLISTPLGFEEFVMYGAGCEDFEYAGRRITWEKCVAALNATVMNLYQAKQLQHDNLPPLLLPEYRFYKGVQERHLSATPLCVVNNNLLDFAVIDESARIKLNIECDFIHRLSGLSDDTSEVYKKQKERDLRLIKEGWQILRFSFKELAGSLTSCVDAVEELCRNNSKKTTVGRCISLPMLSAKINLPVADNDELIAIGHSGGPAAIVGGAGTGKTTCIAERIAFLLGQGVSPERILVLSHSPDTIKVIKNLAEKIMPGQLLDKVNFYAWDDLGMRILKENVSFIKRKLPLKLESSPKKILQKLIAKYTKDLDPTALELHGDLDEQTALNKISACKANLFNAQSIKDREGHVQEQLFAKVYLGYEELLQKTNKIDKDDMTSLAAQVLGQEVELRTRYENLFEHIIVDEQQDVTIACDFIARVLACPNDNIFLVGNDDESIYESENAAPKLLSETSIRLPNAKCHLLKRNWRAHPQITKHAEQFVNEVVATINAGRIEKQTITGWGDVPTQAIIGPYEFFDEVKQGAWLIDQIEELLANGRKPEEIAIICRSKEQLAIFEELLSPYGLVVSTDKADVNLLPDESTDVITFLRLIADPDGPRAKEQFEHICQLRSKALDPKLSGTIASFAETNNLSYLKALEIYSEIASDPYCTQLEQLVKRIRDMHHDKLTPSEIINLLKRPQWLGDYYNSIKLPPRVAYEPLKVMTQMQDEARTFKTVAEFLKNYSPAGGLQHMTDKTHAAINLLTVHETKGREFQIVFMPYLAEEIFPDKNQRNQNEEQRLFYVAITRAREILYLSTAKNINNHVYKPSSFLKQAGLDVINSQEDDDEPVMVVVVEEPVAKIVEEQVAIITEGPIQTQIDRPAEVHIEESVTISVEEPVMVEVEAPALTAPIDDPIKAIVEEPAMPVLEEALMAVVEETKPASIENPVKVTLEKTVEKIVVDQESVEISVTKKKAVIKKEAPPKKSTNLFGLLDKTNLDQVNNVQIVEEIVPAKVEEKKVDLSEAVQKVRAAKARKPKCINCRQNIEPNARFCGECGADQTVVSKRICKACGSALEEAEKFCGQCGSQQ